jgi:mono/diheme cytochrome c family protein
MAAIVSSRNIAAEFRAKQRVRKEKQTLRPRTSSPLSDSLRLVKIPAVPARSLILILSVAVAAGLLGTSGVFAAENEGDKVSFSRDLAPVFLKNCVTCHGPEKVKGDYRLDTFKVLMTPGSSKEAPVVPGKPADSKLYQLITAKDPDDRMPQKAEPLSREQVGLIEKWIAQGASFDGADIRLSLPSIIPDMPRPSPPAKYPRTVPIIALAFSPEGTKLAASGYREITIWNTNGGLEQRITNVAARVQGLHWHSNLIAAATGTPGESGEAVLCVLENGFTNRTLGRISDVMLSAAFSPDGSRLATAGADNSIRLFDVATGKQELLIQQHADWVMSVRWSHDGKRLVSASRDRSTRVYSSQTGELETTYVGHEAPVVAADFAGDDKNVISAGRDKKLHVWNATDAKKVREIGGFEESPQAMLLAGDHLFTACADNVVREHSLDGKLVRTFAGHTDWVCSLAFDPATKRLASGAFDGEMRLWNTANGELLGTFIAAPGMSPKAVHVGGK